jgi:hypothetical protein
MYTSVSLGAEETFFYPELVSGSKQKLFIFSLSQYVKIFAAKLQ